MNEEWKQIFKANKLKHDSKNNYCLDCGHTKIAIINLYPFKEMVCLECGFRSERIIKKELKGGINK